MKKIILTVAAVFAFGVASAQDMNFGAKAGINMSNLTGDAETDAKIGFQVGAFAEFKISEKFAIQPEVMYSALGAKDDADNLNMNFIVIPVMAKYFVSEKFSLEAGPQVALLMSAKYGDVDVKDAFKSTDFGLNLGAGYDVSEKMNVGLRYSMGMSNISEDDTFDIKTSNIALTLGYKF